MQQSTHEATVAASGIFRLKWRPYKVIQGCKTGHTCDVHIQQRQAVHIAWYHCEVVMVVCAGSLCLRPHTGHCQVGLSHAWLYVQSPHSDQPIIVTAQRLLLGRCHLLQAEPAGSRWGRSQDFKSCAGDISSLTYAFNALRMLG